MKTYLTTERLRGIQEKNYKASESAQEGAVSWGAQRADAIKVRSDRKRELLRENRTRTAADADAMFPAVEPPAPDEIVTLQLEVSYLKLEVADLITTCETMRHRLGAHGQQIIDLENLTEKQVYGRS